MTDAQKAALEYPFPVEDIEFRVLRTNKAKTEGYIAAYVDSRAIQRRLDKVVGWENWQNDFDESYINNIKYICLVMSEKYIENHRYSACCNLGVAVGVAICLQGKDRAGCKERG